MRVNKIIIRNLLGIEELQIKPSSLTIIEGENASGKTSVIRALQNLLGGGHDAQLVRKGATKGEAVFVLEDPMQGTITATKVTTTASANLLVESEKFGAVRKPQTFLDKMVDVLAANPVQFLRASSKDRARWLLESLPLVLDQQKLESIIGGRVDVDRNGTTIHPLEQLDRYRIALYDQRTGTSRVAREKQATFEQLRAGLNPDHQNLDQLKAEYQEHLEGHEHLIQEELAARDRVATERTASMLKVKEWQAAEVAKIAAAAQHKMEAIQEKTMAADQALLAHFSPRKQTHLARLQVIENQMEGAVRENSTRELATKMQDEADQAKTEVAGLTAALAQLERYKMELLEGLPIQGLEVRSGEIFLDDIPWDKVNTARQVQTAVQLALLRTGDLKLVCWDGFECLDPDQFAAFEEWASGQQDCQFIVTRVAAGPLRVRAGGDPFRD